MTSPHNRCDTPFSQFGLRNSRRSPEDRFGARCRSDSPVRPREAKRFFNRQDSALKALLASGVYRVTTASRILSSSRLTTFAIFLAA